jgi:hypothetical protein
MAKKTNTMPEDDLEFTRFEDGPAGGCGRERLDSRAAAG